MSESIDNVAVVAHRNKILELTGVVRYILTP